MNKKENLIDNMIPTRGEFTIETYDINDNLIDTYQDNNKIMARVPFNYSCLTYGAGCSGFSGEWPDNPTLSDFKISTIAMGSDGVDEDGVPREIECNRGMLFSEQNLWQAQYNDTITEQAEDLNKFVYQSTFNTQPNLTTDEDFMTEAVKVNEGPSFPWDFDNNLPGYYKMVADGSNGLQFPDTSMEIKSNHKELTLRYEFTLGQFAGNGVWQLAPAFSEAALYMQYIPKHLDGSGIDGKPLGAMFSMKTFPKHFKTEACYFRIKWNLIFGTNTCPSDQLPTIQIIGNTPTYVTVGGVYIEEGATAYDAEDGSLTQNILTSGAVDTSAIGDYVITYYVEDSIGQSASTTRTVTVRGNAIPVITLIGAANINLNLNDTYVEYGANAFDVEDGIISDDIVIDSTDVDTSSGGVYTVTYNVTDSNGGAAIEVTRTVTVTQEYLFEATITEIPIA